MLYSFDTRFTIRQECLDQNINIKVKNNSYQVITRFTRNFKFYEGFSKFYNVFQQEKQQLYFIDKNNQQTKLNLEVKYIWIYY